MGDGAHVPGWESDGTYTNYASYTCVSPSEAHNMTGCNAKRCVPDLVSAYACTGDTDCFDGQVCHYYGNVNGGVENGLCVSCGTTESEARYFAMGACHQVATFNTFAPYEEGESGCAGDHCHHVCAYDTQCVRITSDTTQLDITATHNQLPGMLNLTNTDHDKLERPSSCTVSDAGSASSGMRCASDIHRAVTSRERTPNAIRNRTMDVVELRVQHSDVHNFLTFHPDDVANRALQIDEQWSKGYAIGYEVLDEVKNPQGGNVGTGVFAHCPWGRENNPEDPNYGNCKIWWENQGLVQCEVKYAVDAPLHMTVDGAPPIDAMDASKPRSTLLTRACLRRSSVNGEHTWEESTFVDEGKTCGEWGTTSGLRTVDWNYFPFSAQCSLSGPNVVGVVPTEAQRESIHTGLLSAFNSGILPIHDVIRVSFHDAAAYTPNENALLGGAKGCMRFEHIHGAAPNIGLAFVMENHFWNAVGCMPGVGEGQNGPGCWSMADILQYAGMVAVEAAQGPSFSDQMLWGRLDAPRIFCTGELQTSMPDVDGGHNEGSIIHGSSNVAERLQTTYDKTKAYFENQLGLERDEWIAYLAGGHSVGGVKGLIQARNTKFNFDATPSIFDNLYFKKIYEADKTGLMSLCSGQKSPGDSVWWSSPQSADGQYVMETSGHEGHDVLLDTDIGLTVDDDSMEVVKDLAHDSSLFFSLYESAALYVSELGHDHKLIYVGLSTTTTEAPPSTTEPPQTSSTTISRTTITSTVKTTSSTTRTVTQSPTVAPTGQSTSSPETSSPSRAPSSSPVVTTVSPTQAPTPATTTPPRETHDMYQDVGYCIADNDHEMSGPTSGEECLAACTAAYLDTGMWYTLYVEYYDDVCYCQDSCYCMDDNGPGSITYVPDGFVLPQDDLDWFWTNSGRKKKNCNWVGGKPTKRRCDKVSAVDGVTTAREACPCAGCD